MCGSKQLLSHLAELSGLIINPQTLNRRRRNRRVGSGFRMSAVEVRVHEILSFSCASLVIATQHTAKLVKGPLHLKPSQKPQPPETSPSPVWSLRFRVVQNLRKLWDILSAKTP